jgi:predicted alpha/beta superfamily hydrolase
MCKIETFNVTIPYTGLPRRVWVCLPSGYATSEKRYPVLYMHDGQNLFDESTSYAGVTWEAHIALEKAMIRGESDGVILVGIDNASIDGNEVVGRLDEYSPWINTELKSMMSARITRDVGGYGDKYAKFLALTLKPMIDAKYRTLTNRENTGVAGSSMGGFISLYIGLVYDDIFSKIGAFSTAAWFKQDELIKLIHEHGPDTNSKWYLDIGTKETSSDEVAEFNQIYLDGTMAIYDTLLQVGVKEDCIKLVVDEGAQHNEAAWARRFPNAFQWLFEQKS